MLAKNSLALAKQGYELMDKKRNILIRELMNLIEEAKNIQTQIDSTFTEAYQALQQANIEVGIHYVQQIAQAVPVETKVRIKTRSIMGTEIPLVEHEEEKKVPYYGFYNSSESVDAARENFRRFGKEDRITLLEGDAAQVLSQLEGPYELIFMDAAKAQYPVLLKQVLRLLSDGGLLVSDNVLQDGDILESRYAVTRRNRTIHARMREYLYEIKHHPCLVTSILPVGDGVAVSVARKEEEKKL